MAKDRWRTASLDDGDIICHILGAVESGDRDEALWRAFLAAHFGRSSADKNVDGQVQSAARLLCGFGSSPMWMWQWVSRDPEAFRRWLFENEEKLRLLSYGNHRKYESKQARNMWQVFRSFLDLVQQYGGRPSAVFEDASVETQGQENRFDLFYRRLRSIWRFGRTGAFDFIELLVDLKLIEAVPASCYLAGATGPLAGARKLWGRRPVKELDALAVALAARLGVSPFTVEDTLCNWQKREQS